MGASVEFEGAEGWREERVKRALERERVGGWVGGGLHLGVCVMLSVALLLPLWHNLESLHDAPLSFARESRRIQTCR